MTVTTSSASVRSLIRSFLGTISIMVSITSTLLVASPFVATAFAPSIGSRHSSFQQMQMQSNRNSNRIRSPLWVSPFPFDKPQQESFSTRTSTATTTTTMEVVALIKLMERYSINNNSSNNNKPENLYDILGASMDDSPAVLKRKYVALAKKSHPDMATESTIDFSEVTAAYAVLSDPVQRRKYDRHLVAADWTDMICYLLGGLAEFFVLFWQVLLPLSQEMFHEIATTSNQNAHRNSNNHHEDDANDLFFATLVA